MKHCCIELRIMDCETGSSVNLGDYEEFDDELKNRVEMLLNADCDVMLRPYTWSNADED